MESEASGEVLTRRNHKLLNIAKVCEVFAWIFLVVNIFYAYTSYTIIIQNVETRSINDNAYNLTPKMYRLDHANFTRVKTDPLVFFKIAVDVLIEVLKGVLGFLVLYGTSYGLKMIVETDINNRLTAGEKFNE
ncbi:MAG TPA: hypothetical protein DIW44_09985 [Anaerolineaceae bacterium]|nr:hypothetical protein [Anaerolineaceae bacterium]